MATRATFLNLTDQQRNLLRQLVTNHELHGGKLPFFFTWSKSGGGLSYTPTTRFHPEGDETDLCRLRREDLVDFTSVGDHAYRGKPTQLGINAVHNDFIEVRLDEPESATCISSSVERLRVGERPMKRTEFEAAMKQVGEEHATLNDALTAAFRDMDPKMLEDVSVLGALSTSAYTGLTAAPSEIDSRALESLRSGLMEYSIGIATALDGLVEDTTDKPEPAPVAPVNDPSREATAERVLEPRLLEPSRSPEGSAGAAPSAPAVGLPVVPSVAASSPRADGAGDLVPPNEHVAPAASIVVPADSRRVDGDATSWDEIEIWFISDVRVQIRKGTELETYNYAELGFADGRARRGKAKPNQAWIILRRMAERNGIIRDEKEAGSPWPKVEKRIQEIRNTLRKHFRTTNDPISLVEGTGYQTRFKLSCGPSFDT